MVKCEACGKKEEELGRGLQMMRCARCYSVSYCNGECQRADWAAHKAVCKERAKEIKAVKAKAVSLVGGDEGLDAATLRRAADVGDADAMTELGICYQFGTGDVGEDAVEAVHWYSLATEARNPPAEAYNNLANCFYGGDGVLKNLPEAARLYRIAAEMGYPLAQYRLGLCLQRGEGMPFNPVEAFTWIKRAADAGDAGAQCQVGYSLDTGLGVPEDKAAGVGYFRRAADQGHADAMYNLGVCYFKGDGVPQDNAQAVAWMMRARDAGDPSAAKALAEIAPHLTPAECAAADQLLITPLPRMPATTAPATAATGGAGAPPLTRADVLTMGTGALKRLLKGRGVDVAGIDEKARLIELALLVIGEAPQ